jgi:hypothetical protein
MRDNKLLIILFFIGVLVVTMSTLLYDKIFGDRSVIKENFNVNLQDLKLRKLKENEKWYPNGDGMKVQVFEYDKLNKEIINGLNKLPIKDDLPSNEIPKEFLENTGGYYKCIINREDNRNFDILIIDTLKKKICVYYQIM